MPPPPRPFQVDVRGLRPGSSPTSTDQVDSLAYAMHTVRQGTSIESAIRSLQELGLDVRPGTIGRTLAEVTLRESEAILARTEETLPLVPVPGVVLHRGNYANLNGDALPSREALRAMFEHLDRQPLRPDFPPLYPGPLNPPPEPEPTPWTMHELRGEAVVNTRALQAMRVTVPEFEIASNPTIQLGDIRARRFDLIDRTYDHPILLALLAHRIKRAMELEWKGEDPHQKQTPVKGSRRTAWERLLEDD